MENLGFGMMRLPVLSGPTDFDYKQLNEITDIVEKAVAWLTENSF